MGDEPQPRPGSRPRVSRAAAAICGFAALTSAAAGLMVMAPGSLAHSGDAERALTPQSDPHPGYHKGKASWYNDAHDKTACGFKAKYGVANRTLKCGTKVQFIYKQYRVTGVVDDRGPYTAGRTWDLDLPTANALHMTSAGVVTVWAKW